MCILILKRKKKLNKNLIEIICKVYLLILLFKRKRELLKQKKKNKKIFRYYQKDLMGAGSVREKPKDIFDEEELVDYLKSFDSRFGGDIEVLRNKNGEQILKLDLKFQTNEDLQV